jgi:hypothetical protein
MTIRQPDLPISLAGHLLPCISVLDKIGAQWWKSLSHNGLPTEIENPLAMLPTLSVLKFIHQYQKLGRNSMSKQFGFFRLNLLTAFFVLVVITVA